MGREEGYWLPTSEIVRRAREAVEMGATEICVQARIERYWWSELLDLYRTANERGWSRGGRQMASWFPVKPLLTSLRPRFLATYVDRTLGEVRPNINSAASRFASCAVFSQNPRLEWPPRRLARCRLCRFS